MGTTPSTNRGARLNKTQAAWRGSILSLCFRKTRLVRAATRSLKMKLFGHWITWAVIQHKVNNNVPDLVRVYTVLPGSVTHTHTHKLCCGFWIEVTISQPAADLDDETAETPQNSSVSGNSTERDDVSMKAADVVVQCAFRDVKVSSSTTGISS